MMVSYLQRMVGCSRLKKASFKITSFFYDETVLFPCLYSTLPMYIIPMKEGSSL